MPEKIKIQTKIGILNTIAKSIYTTAHLKFREAVANSMDNNAQNFILFFNPETQALSLFDDGDGISREKMNKIFNSLGYGKQKKDKFSNSYFGLGLMSIIQLGKKAKIYSKAKGKDELWLLEINSGEIFKEENEDKPIEIMNEYLVPKKVNFNNRDINSPLDKDYIINNLGAFPTNFCEIVIEDVSRDVFEFIVDNEAETELRKLLPLEADPNAIFLNSIKDPFAKEWIINLINYNKTYCPTINFLFGIEKEKEIKKLTKYFPNFKQDLYFESSNIICKEEKEDEDNKFAYYILTSTEDLEEKQKEDAETGFWVRNRNFLVKSADFFQEPGSRKKIIHEPLTNWLFGEIFHENMTGFLEASRREYAWNSEEFKKFKNKITEHSKDLNKKLRKVWTASNKILKSVVEPFKIVDKSEGPFNRVIETLSQLELKINLNEIENVFEYISKIRNESLENEDYRVDKLIETETDNILMYEDEDTTVEISKDIRKDDFIKLFDPETKRINLKISSKLFSPRKVMLLDESYDLFFVHSDDEDKGISIDRNRKKIFVNIFNHDIRQYSVSFIDVYIAVEVADMLAEDKEEMKHYLLNLLGKQSKIDTSDYFIPLADDLQRIKANLW